MKTLRQKNEGVDSLLERVVTVFGSSLPRPGDRAYEEAQELGRLLASSGFTLCNGGYGGTMEATARGAREAGGKTIGVTTAQFAGAKVNRWVTEERRTPTWKERLFLLIELGSAYVVLEGGTGTLVELACVWEMMRKDLMSPRPVFLLGKFWRRFIRFLKENREIPELPSFRFVDGAEAAVQELERLLANR